MTASDEQVPALDTLFDTNSLDDWARVAEQTLEDGQTLDDLIAPTADGLAIAALYHDAADDAPDSLPNIQSAWDNRVHLLGKDADELQRHALRSLEGGATSLELDLTRLQSTAELERSLDSVSDGIDLSLAPLHLVPGLHFRSVLESWQGVLSQRDVDPASYHGGFGMDPIAARLCRGTEALPAEQSISEALGEFAASASEWTTTWPEAPLCRVDVAVHHNAGATPVMELVAAVATGATYVDALLDAGFPSDRLSRNLVFRFTSDADLRLSVIKLRAFRWLWSDTLRQSRHEALQDLAAQAPRLEVETSRRMLSLLDPWNNHLRNVSAVASAALANAETIMVHPHVVGDATLADGSERVARNIPIILAEESRLGVVADPFAGSHAVEALTRELATVAAKRLATLTDDGGFVRSLAEGHWQNELAETRHKRLERLQTKADVMVGVNRYRPGDAPELDISESAEDAESRGDWPPLRLHRASRPFESSSA